MKFTTEDSIRGVQPINVSVAQMEVIPARPDLNFKTIKKIISAAKKDKVDLLVLPELCLSGYLIGDMWEEQSFVYDCEYYGQEICRLSDNIAIAFSNVVTVNTRANDGRIMKLNAVFIAENRRFRDMCGNHLTFQPKALLPNYREFEEPRHFTGIKEYFDLEYENIEIKDIYTPVEIGGFNIGFNICEDGWDYDYELSPMSMLVENGAQLLINLSCSPYTKGKNDSRDKVFAGHAREHKVPVVYCNSIGLQNNGKTIYTFDGSSVIYDHMGNVKAHLKSFSEGKINFLFPSEVLVKRDSEYDYNYTMSKKPEISDMYDAILYGTKKYCEQSGIKRVVIGISGGIDSAVAAGIYVDALGADNVMLVNMPSKYNSDTTKSIAESIANNLNCLYTVIPIQESVTHTQEQVNNAKLKVLGNYTSDDINITLSDFDMENVQARDRSSRILSAVSSAWNAVFTNNGNKTETTVGYATLYGDVAGFMANLADVWKTDVYKLGKEINHRAGRDIIPKKTFEIEASAELSDTQGVEEGQGDPLKYWYHDKLFATWIERWNRYNISDIARLYQDGLLTETLGLNEPETIKFNDMFAKPEDFFNDLEMWWKRFRGIALAKRIQAPPVLAVSKRAYGFDYRESLNSGYIGREYYQIKEDFLSK